jgi:outer membrane lipoprotein-sorting protein
LQEIPNVLWFDAIIESRESMVRISSKVLLVFALLVAHPSQGRGQDTPRDIIDRVDRILRGDSSYGKATMEVVTEHWNRSLSVEVWSLGTEYSLIRLTAPAREAGTATLKAGSDIWNYLPKVDRTIKVPASMMAGAWMGSHFTNDDLVKESRLVEDYDIGTSFEGDRDGVAVWEFHLTPKPEAPVVWGHIEYRVRKEDFMPLWARYYDEEGQLSRRLEFSDFRKMGGRTVPAVMNMYPEDKPGERTTMLYENIEFDIDLEESFFSLQALKRRR